LKSFSPLLESITTEGFAGYENEKKRGDLIATGVLGNKTHFSL
jgi:hypothetical protein